MRIVALRLDEYGTGHYRITAPMRALQELGHSCTILQAEYGKRFGNAEFAGDILWIQRMNDPMIYRMVQAIPEQCRPIVVYEIDDLLWNLKDWHRNADKLDLERTVPPMLRMSDAVTCSTKELAKECSVFNSCIHVSPNSLDANYRNWEGVMARPPEAEGKIVIGWSGGGWHEGDLAAMGKALRHFLLAHPECHFIGQGDAPNLARWMMQDLRLPSKRCSLIDWMSFEDHPSVYSLFDIGIAPLGSNPYNRCKSDLKLLELGASRVPYVASRIAPYIQFHIEANYKGGFLAKSYEEWIVGLAALLDCEKRARMGTDLQAYIRSERTVECQSLKLEAFFKKLIGQKNGQAIGRANLDTLRNRTDSLVPQTAASAEGSTVQ